jgi:hypothetical protein
MAYRLFSTDNADYVLQLSTHEARNTQVSIFEGIDSMIIETSGYKLGDYLFGGDDPQYQMPLDFCKNNQVPVFGTDVDVSNLLFSVLTEVVGSPIYLPLVYLSLSKSPINNTVSQLVSSYSLLTQTSLIEARNATNARNIEEFVVPRVREISGKEKPKIGMVYGAGHMGLEYNLKSEKRRNFTIANYRNFNFRKYSGLDREKLNQVDEANFDGESWQITEHPTNLFD